MFSLMLSAKTRIRIIAKIFSMRYLALLVFLLAAMASGLFAQHDLHHTHDHAPGEPCGTMPYLEMMKASDPGLEARMESMEKQTQAWIAQNAHRLKQTNNVITIPVVVHVVYATSAQNVSDQQIFSQIEVLNRDFRRLNPDTGNTPSVFKPVGADPGIEFCLASRDPQGNFTTGITRTPTTNTNFTTFNNAVKYDVTGGKTAWNTSEYLNMWVCNIQGTVLGYAQFPGGNPATDGVVIDYQAFGTMGSAQNPYNGGRTTTHEIGHWLNLYHIWGDDGGACTGTDYVGDTPNQGSEYYGCPSFPKTSCGTQDMFMNYMDYVNDNCSNLFTQGQKDRMQAAINIWRTGLLTSGGCVTQPPQALFAVDRRETVPGCGVSFTDQSVGSVQSYFWQFEGGSPATSTSPNPSNIVFSQPGQWQVSLVVSNVMGSDTLLIPAYITVSDTLRAVPDFESEKRYLCAGEVIQIFDQSSHCPNAWTWTFDPPTVSFHAGTHANSKNPVVSFDTEGMYNVSLDVSNINGQRSLAKTAYIVVGGMPLEFAEYFDSGDLLEKEWETENPNGDFSWEVQTVASGLPDNKAAVIPIYGSNSLGYRDRLISAPVDLRNQTEAYLMFKHAYAQYQNGISDSLIVYISDDCGGSWTRIFAGGEDGNGSFATHPITTSKFVPANTDDWCGGSFGSPCAGIDISAWAGQANVKFAFESFSFISQNIYLDDVRVASVLSRTDNQNDMADIEIYPNPSDGHIQIRSKNIYGNFILRLNNLQGKAVYEDDIQLTKDNYLSLALPDLPAGMYLMNLVGDSQVVTRKLILR